MATNLNLPQDTAPRAFAVVPPVAGRGVPSPHDELDALRREFAEVYRELYEAVQMQRKLSGPRQLRRRDFDLAAEIFPVRHLSGDFCTIADCGDSVLLAIGDIEGKGLAAGMWFTEVMGFVRSCGELSRDPAAAVEAINFQMCTHPVRPPLTSLFLARLHPASGTLYYCNAGHPAPLLARASGEMEFLRDGGVVLGVLPQARFSVGRMTLRPGDALVGFSDGLTECRNAEGEEFGAERLVTELNRAEPASAASVLFSIVGAVQDFAGSHCREDDFGLMVVLRDRE